MTLEQLHAAGLKLATGFFAEHDGIPPIFLAIDRKGDLHILPAPNYPDHRDFFCTLLKAYFLHHGVSVYAFTSEAWMVVRRMKRGSPLPVVKSATGALRMAKGELPASEAPDRVECLLLTARDRHGYGLQFCNKITRQPGQKPQIGESLMEKKEGIPLVDTAGLYGLFEPGGEALQVLRLATLLDQGEVPLKDFFPGMMRVTNPRAN